MTTAQLIDDGTLDTVICIYNDDNQLVNIERFTQYDEEYGLDVDELIAESILNFDEEDCRYEED